MVPSFDSQKSIGCTETQLAEVLGLFPTVVAVVKKKWDLKIIVIFHRTLNIIVSSGFCVLKIKVKSKSKSKREGRRFCWHGGKGRSEILGYKGSPLVSCLPFMRRCGRAEY